jgi:transposase
MPESPTQPVLFSAGAAEAERSVAINGRCMVRKLDGVCVVMVVGVQLAHFSEGDRMAEAHAMVSLVGQGWAKQREVAKAFGCSSRTVRRHQERFNEGGMAALGHRGGFPAGRARLPERRRQQVSRMKGAGRSNREIAAHLGVTEGAVRKLLKRLGWVERGPKQQRLSFDAGADPNVSASPAPHGEPQAKPAAPAADPNVSASPVPHEQPQAVPAEPAADPNVSGQLDDGAFTGDTDPADRAVDRFLAAVGLLDDAVPLFRPGTRVPCAGVLLALPALVASGVFDCARDVYGNIGPAFYGLRTTVLSLLLMALMRIKRPEALKEHSPQDLGRVLGLDRALEVKTLRRKLSRLAALGRAEEFGRALAKRRAGGLGDALGFLYVDGHVRAYHGSRTLPKAHVTQLRLSMPATTDYWVGDARGDPLLVVTADANAGLVKMLPPVLAEVRKAVGDRRVTVVFDRGGYSPKLFQKLVDGNFDVLTYRKGNWRQLPETAFSEHRITVDGHEVVYKLADREVQVGPLMMRQVTRLSDNGHQTPILTTRRDLSAAEVATAMFARWKQENFFKYLLEEYALDALIDYGTVPDNPTRLVPNPRRLALDEELREAREAVKELHSIYGLEADMNRESTRRTMRGFKVAQAPIGAAIREQLELMRDLVARREKTPTHVPIRDVVAGEIIKLAPEKKHLSNVLKMVAYQAESELTRLVEPLYRRADDEGRTLVQTMLATAADLEVEGGELHVRFVPLSAAHRTTALAALCEQLNATKTRFPGSRLTLRFAVKDG